MAELDALRRQLAAIEHARWADWQRWMHEQCSRRVDGSLVIPAVLVERWERQIATPFDQLSEAEQRSGMDQVDRYWPLIGPALGRIPELERERDGWQEIALRVQDGTAFWKERAERVEARIPELERKVELAKGLLNGFEQIDIERMQWRTRAERAEAAAQEIYALEHRYEREKVDHARQHGRTHFDFEDDPGLDGRSRAASEAAEILRAALAAAPAEEGRCSPAIVASTVMRYERRDTMPSLDALAAWAGALGFDLRVSLVSRPVQAPAQESEPSPERMYVDGEVAHWSTRPPEEENDG